MCVWGGGGREGRPLTAQLLQVWWEVGAELHTLPLQDMEVKAVTAQFYMIQQIEPLFLLKDKVI